MDELIATRYWCHMCSQMVNPIVDVEIKCPFCRSGFVEEIGNGISNDNNDNNSNNNELESDFGSERALSLWAPILLGMMGNPRGRRRFRHLEFDEDDDDNEHEDGEGNRVSSEPTDLDSVIRRRRSSATILQLLQGIRAGMATAESENSYEGERSRERERVILINPFNQTIVVQGGENQNQNPIGSLGDYFVGPGLDLLLQHLAENDPNRYGTPPAQKEAVDALPTVRVEPVDSCLQCAVCLDEFEVDEEAKEMPCKHKFHTGCILPWLELHSSCPVCRHQLPGDESKRDADGGSTRFMGDLNNANGSGSGEIIDGRNASGTGRRFSFPWPFNGLFSAQGNSSGGSASDSQRDHASI
ncbi:E3 ubiquitin-protein ligase SIRP1 [Benincasa hispida]|uniref:E3 ubiquitin-protein ligase SIRP1 n=1 Tax=Benincasa hispida TaxID=102211 RepID=UPI0018FFB2D9|nr:E3 ubiquitin-protein ligase SIRP1 [Benincasa hispida]XP_038901762.1 E3 ubiquitin-protein ligase SIRP1 [Benincasa hispida]